MHESDLDQLSQVVRASGRYKSPRDPASLGSWGQDLDQGLPVACPDSAGVPSHGGCARVIQPHSGHGLGQGQPGELICHAGRAHKPAQAEVQERETEEGKAGLLSGTWGLWANPSLLLLVFTFRKGTTSVHREGQLFPLPPLPSLATVFQACGRGAWELHTGRSGLQKAGLGCIS